MLDMDSCNTMRRTRAENASFVIAAVRASGIEPHPQSRLMQMYRVLTRSTEIIQRDDPDFDTALEAVRDMQLLGIVFDQSNAHPHHGDFQSLVKRMLKDSVLPQRDRAQSKGRDAQFELYLAAICQSAGLVPVDCAEPDVTCTIEGVKFGIAAKRLKNISNLGKRVEKAALQIERAHLPGIIAVDTCSALNPSNDRIGASIPDPQFGRLYKEFFTRLLDRYHQQIYACVHGKGVRGVVFHDNQVRFEPNGEWGLCGMTYWLPTAHDDPQASREFSLFKSSYVKGLVNLEHS